MNRRSFLVSAGSLPLAALAGCSSLVEQEGGNDVQDSDGDGVIDSEDYAPNDPNVQEKSDLTGEGGAEPETTDDDGSSGGPDQYEVIPGDSDGGNEDTETEANRQLKREILRKYNEAVSTHNSAMETTNTAVSQANNGDYASAHTNANLAERKFEETEDQAQEAFDKVLQLDNPDAKKIISDAITYASKMQASTEEMQLAFKNDDDADLYNRHIENSREYRREAEEINLRPPTTLETVLGL